MRLFLTAALVAWAGAAAALPALTVPVLAPQVNEVKIINITAIGSGCPAGHAVINIDATGTIFDIAFDQYTASVGPGNLPADARKNCRVSINLQFPAGFQFSIIETRFQGYASLTEGQTGVCRAGYTFSGDSSQEVVFQKNVVAPYEDNYNMLAGVGIESYSRCGTTAILNVNSEIRIMPVTSPYKGLMTVDSFDGNVHVVFKALWRKC